MKDAMVTLRKDMENMERHLSKYGRDCNTLEEELMKLEELHTHETLLWIKVTYITVPWVHTVIFYLV